MAVPTWLSALGHLASDVFGGIVGAGVVDEWKKKVVKKVVDEKYRETFGVLVSKMPEPYRTKLNEHCRKASAAFCENKMVRLLVQATESLSEEQKLEYLQYVSMLDWDAVRADPTNPAIVYPSCLEELDKLYHDPVPEFFQRHHGVIVAGFAAMKQAVKAVNEELRQKREKFKERLNQQAVELDGKSNRLAERKLRYSPFRGFYYKEV